MAHHQGNTEATSYVHNISLTEVPDGTTAPRGYDPHERPFGLRLSGSLELDYDRIYVRLAARQAGLIVDDEDEGKVRAPGPMPNPSQLALLHKVTQMDKYYDRNFRKISAASIPDGFIPALWKDAATIQGRIPRGQEARGGRGSPYQAPEPLHPNRNDNGVDFIQPALLEAHPTTGFSTAREIPVGGREAFRTSLPFVGGWGLSRNGYPGPVRRN